MAVHLLIHPNYSTTKNITSIDPDHHGGPNQGERVGARCQLFHRTVEDRATLLQDIIDIR